MVKSMAADPIHLRYGQSDVPEIMPDVVKSVRALRRHHRHRPIGFSQSGQ
jgi:hypothetical protein